MMKSIKPMNQCTLEMTKLNTLRELSMLNKLIEGCVAVLGLCCIAWVVLRCLGRSGAHAAISAYSLGFSGLALARAGWRSRPSDEVCCQYEQ